MPGFGPAAEQGRPVSPGRSYKAGSAAKSTLAQSTSSAHALNQGAKCPRPNTPIKKTDRSVKKSGNNEIKSHSLKPATGI
jgi:hypothetical protein